MDIIITPFNYTGSKHRLLPQILPLFDYSKPDFIDLFAGGGSVYANVVTKFQAVLVNDILSDLIECHNLLLRDGQYFVDEVKRHCVDKTDADGYAKLRTAYNELSKGHVDRPAMLFALMLSCTNNMLRFNKSFKFNQTFGRRSFNDKTQVKCVSFIKALAPYYDKIVFASLPFNEVTKHDWKRVMIYADPPYEGTEAGYNAFWDKDADNRLYQYLIDAHKSGASFALSGVRGGHKDETESPVVTQLIKDGFRVHDITHDYVKVARNKTERRGQEILITNY